MHQRNYTIPIKGEKKEVSVIFDGDGESAHAIRYIFINGKQIHKVPTINIIRSFLSKTLLQG